MSAAAIEVTQVHRCACGASVEYPSGLHTARREFVRAHFDCDSTAVLSTVVPGRMELNAYHGTICVAHAWKWDSRKSWSVFASNNQDGMIETEVPEIEHAEAILRMVLAVRVRAIAFAR